MNILKIQDDLKNFSQQQLVKEIQRPSGNIPQFLILSELSRRKRMQTDQARAEAANTPTVAQEAVAAAGMPMGGVAQMAQAMAPRTSMTENTGIASMMPKQPTRMAGGGVIKANTGLPKSVVIDGFKFNVYPDGRVVRDMVGQPTTPLDPNMTNDKLIIDKAIAAAKRIPSALLPNTLDEAKDLMANRKVAAGVGPEGTKLSGEALGLFSYKDYVDSGLMDEDTLNFITKGLMPPTAQNQTVIPEMQPKIDTVAPSGNLSGRNLLSGGRLLASDPTAAVTATEIDTGLPAKTEKLIDEGTIPAMTYNQMVARVKAGLPLTEADLVKSVEAGLLNDQQAADVNSMLDGYVPSKTMQDIANLNPTDNATVTRSVAESLNQPNVSGRNLLTGVDVGGKGSDTSRPEQGGEDGEDGKDPLKTELDRIAAIEAKSSGALLEFLKDIEKDKEKDAIMDLVRFGSILMKPTPTIGQGIADAAIGTLDAKKERKKDYRKNKIAILGLSERIAAQKAAAARSNALLNVQLQNLDLRKQSIDAAKNKAAMEELERKYKLLDGEGNYEKLMRKLKDKGSLPPDELKQLKELQDLRDLLTGTSTSAKKVNTADT
tara:strand:+ start:566 stop:2371 length:1806 start_codon:yes stop_codon:yes gene_type:complete